MLWITSDRHILSFLGILGLVFGYVSSIGSCHHFRWSWPYLVSHVTWKQKLLKLRQLTSFFNGTMPKGRVHSDAKTDVWVWCDLHYQKSNDVIKFLWHHNFFNKVHFNISIRQFLHLNALYLLGVVPSEKDASCLSFRSFCFQVTWLTKYGHDYRKWWQPPIEEIWPNTNPGILLELKIWCLEVIHSNHFELFCS